MTEPATHFDEMAARIRRNSPTEFQGCYLIVAPDGTLISNALFNPEPDPGAFWALVGAAVDTAIKVFQHTELNQQGYRR